MLNVVLVGMPGCGKTSLGILLAKKLGHTFADADLEVEKAVGYRPKESILDLLD
jgi:shikimate kinase